MIVTIAANQRKQPLFTTEERIQFIQRRDAARRRSPAVRRRSTACSSSSASAHNANVIVRGLRALADFEYEFQFAHMNRRLAPGIDSVFFMTDERNHYVSVVARQRSRQPRRRRHRPRACCRRRRAQGEVQEVSEMPTPLKIAVRLDPIKPSITLAVTAKAAKLKADGIDVVSFGAGEPDFDTPDAHQGRRARRRSSKGVGKYTEVGGVVALRKAIAAELSARAQDDDRSGRRARVVRREALALQPVHGAARSGRRGPRSRRRTGSATPTW